MKQDFGRVAVLMGGVAAEREVSLRSGQAVLKGLLAAGVEAQAFDVTCLTQLVEIASRFDRAFIALHGRWGEDGQVQAILQSLNMPFSGSGMAASALAMDKLRTKWVWRGAGLSTPGFAYASPEQALDLKSLDLGFPLMVKPSHEGSSIGMRKVYNLAELEDAVQEARAFDSEVLIEQFIEGREFTVALLNGQILPAIELKTSHDFYDFDAKYQANDTQYICPCDLPEAVQSQINQLVLDGFKTLGAEGWGRMDVMLDHNNQAWLIELNTVPGMTEKSLVPKAAKQAGISFDQLVLEILRSSLSSV
ncbi:D-alanine--D-alanine ligase [Thiomicrospira microaerophila]|uniref:D-alanine--D-alanine ligase n=1 Tax=Thiomicrospira microaerophila TaxID=406020 RepID=UPI00200DFD52|nr:D-alanine--D-alanine ligase [Thiomicrospira microaerophila]UQB42591.1 D-alanine--D-alanine ligase [Thiomicrospira microaerophila]